MLIMARFEQSEVYVTLLTGTRFLSFEDSRPMNGYTSFRASAKDEYVRIPLPP